MSSRIVVVGIGNPLLRDDGVGVRVVELLAQCDLPPDVRLIDAGVRGMDMYDVLTGDADEVWIVDAMRDGDRPAGTVHRLDDLVKHLNSNMLGWSGHDVGIAHALHLANALKQRTPSIRLFGIVPESVDGGLELSPAVDRTATQLAQDICDELRARHGPGAAASTQEAV